MKLQVIRADGKIELLTLVLPVSAETESESGYCRIGCADGTGHFFNGDGTYDGWDRKMDIAIEGTQGVNTVLDKALEIDSQREILPPAGERNT